MKERGVSKIERNEKEGGKMRHRGERRGQRGRRAVMEVRFPNLYISLAVSLLVTKRPTSATPIETINMSGTMMTA